MSAIDPAHYGVSFSLKQCRNFGLDPKETFDWLAAEAGFRRFRLMSYWDEHEKQPSVYDFAGLDWQVARAEKYSCVVTLCLGARQPRWPENHWPEWAWKLPKADRTAALLAYIETVVKRYQDKRVIISYQLENEALLRSFGERPEIDRRRLLQEYQLIKQLDQKRPIIMTTSTAWGIPIRQPIPDIVGFSFYRILYGAGSYHHALHFPRLDRLRARATQVLHHRPSFIHELQLEPWGPAPIWNMSTAEQDKSMSVEHIQTNLRLAQRTLLSPIDLWGGEWWYWRLQTKYDPTIWQAVQTELQD